MSEGYKLKGLFFLFAILIPAICFGQLTEPPTDLYTDPYEIVVPGYVIVKFKEGVDPSSAEATNLFDEAGAEEVERTFPTAEVPDEDRVTLERLAGGIYLHTGRTLK